MKVISFTHNISNWRLDEGRLKILDAVWVCFDGIEQFAPALAPVVKDLVTFDVRVSTRKIHGYDAVIRGDDLYYEMNGADLRKLLSRLGIIEECEGWKMTEIHRIITNKKFYFKLVKGG